MFYEHVCDLCVFNAAQYINMNEYVDIALSDLVLFVTQKQVVSMVILDMFRLLSVSLS